MWNLKQIKCLVDIYKQQPPWQQLSNAMKILFETSLTMKNIRNFNVHIKLGLLRPWEWPWVLLCFSFLLFLFLARICIFPKCTMAISSIKYWIMFYTFWKSCTDKKICMISHILQTLSIARTIRQDISLTIGLDCFH